MLSYTVKSYSQVVYSSATISNLLYKTYAQLNE